MSGPPKCVVSKDTLSVKKADRYLTGLGSQQCIRFKKKCASRTQDRGMGTTLNTFAQP